MKPIIAYCGLQCHNCPILPAAQEPEAKKQMDHLRNTLKK